MMKAIRTLHSGIKTTRPSTRTSEHGVNLGLLYAKPINGQPTGWAYFQDGSVYIHSKTRFVGAKHCLNHDEMEAEMRLLEPIVRQPPPEMEHLRAHTLELKRLILLGFKPLIWNLQSQNPGTVCVRNAADFERVVIETRSFKAIEISYDPSNPSQPSAKYHTEPSSFTGNFRASTSYALQEFRGTLIDGVLQPNVLLGNGLQLDTSHHFDREKRDQLTRASRIAPRKQSRFEEIRASKDHMRDIEEPSQHNSTHPQNISEREAELNRRERQLLNLQQLLMQSVGNSTKGMEKALIENLGPPPSQEHRSETDQKTAELEARVRELQRTEQVLRLKNKNLVLKQQLAAAKAKRIQFVSVPPAASESHPEPSSRSPFDPAAAQDAPESASAYGDELDDLFPSGPRTRIRLPRRPKP